MKKFLLAGLIVALTLAMSAPAALAVQTSWGNGGANDFQIFDEQDMIYEFYLDNTFQIEFSKTLNFYLEIYSYDQQTPAPQISFTQYYGYDSYDGYSVAFGFNPDKGFVTDHWEYNLDYYIYPQPDWEVIYLQIMVDGSPYTLDNELDYASLVTVCDTPPPSNVPLPGAVWLLGSGLIGLVGFGRKLFG